MKNVFRLMLLFLFQAAAVNAATIESDKVFAVFKASHNGPGSAQAPQGGVAGSAFFVASRTAVTANHDVKLIDARVISISNGSRVGMSGGPILSQGRVIGLASYGLPAGEDEKKRTFRISIQEIRAHLPALAGAEPKLQSQKL